MPNPFAEQGISKILRMLQHPRSHTISDRGSLVGSALESSLQLLQLEAGCEGQVLESAYGLVAKMITRCWMQVLWEFLGLCSSVC